MGHVGWVVRGQQTALADALACATAQGHWENYPPAQLRRMARVDRSPYRFSPSQMSRCVRQGVLRRDYAYWLDPESEARMARGSGWHAYLDEGLPGQSEQYLKAPVGGLTLEGTLDYYEPQTGTIYDYKTTRTLQYRAGGRQVERDLLSPEYELQVNMYALLARLNELEVTRAFLVFYADSGARRVIPVPLWSLDEQRAVAESFARELQAAAARDPEPPAALAPESPEAWQCRYCPVATLCRTLEAEGR